ERITQLMRHDRQKLIFQTVRVFRGLPQLVLALQQVFTFFFDAFALEVIGSLPGQQIEQAQLLFAWSMSVSKVNGDEPETIFGAAKQRQRLHSQHIGVAHRLERMLAGVDLTVGNVFNNHALSRAKGDTTRRIVTDDAFKKLYKRLVETTLGRELKNA